MENLYKNFWDFFKNSGTILTERLTVLIGLITTGVAAMDWSPIVSLVGTGPNFNTTQLYWLGGLMAAKGILGEIIRRNNTKEVQSRLIPESSPTLEVKTKVK